jgi:hypothetical protein
MVYRPVDQVKVHVVDAQGIAAVMEGLAGLVLLAVAQLGGDEDFLPGDP